MKKPIKVRAKNLVKRVLPQRFIDFGVRQVRSTMGVIDVTARGKQVNETLKSMGKEKLGFFAREIPTSEAFPFKVHYPELLENVPENVRDLFLVGRNWTEAPDKPVAVAVGFNQWKLGFIAEYLREYRVAFADTRGMRPVLKTVFARHKTKSDNNPEPSALFIWGYKDGGFLTDFAKKQNVPLFRVEDGFIRSANLGAAHTVPYSLIVDSGELHFRNDGTGDLEHLLNTYDFDNDPELLAHAAEAMKLISEHGLSKYNLPSTTQARTYHLVKARKRVLIVGQVDKDAAVRMGNPQKWRATDLVRLARLENPDAQILYRPHPEVYRGYQKSIFRTWKVSEIAQLISPDVPMLQALEGVDHVYTISSLSGMEALLRGIKVTTVGTPFYAGWGLTDDRTPLERRGRKLSITELFAGVYIKYPRYLGDLDDPTKGFTLAAMRINADRRHLFRDFFQENEEVNKEQSIAKLAGSEMWPTLFLDPKYAKEDTAPLAFQYIRSAPVVEYFQKITGLREERVMLFAMAGWLQNEEDRDWFLGAVREFVHHQNFNALLLLLERYRPGAYLAKHFAWLLTHHGAPRTSSRFMQGMLEVSRKLRAEAEAADAEVKDDAEVEEEAEEPVDPFRLTPEQASLLEDTMQAQMDDTDYDEAERSGMTLLINGYINQRSMFGLAEIAIHRFDFDAAYSIAWSMFCVERVASKVATLISRTIPVDSETAFVEDYAMALSVKPSLVSGLVLPQVRYADKVDVEAVQPMLTRLLYMDNDQTVSKAQAWMAIDEADRAVEVLQTLVEQGDTDGALMTVYTQALSFADRVDEAFEIIMRGLKAYPISVVYREAMRLCVLKGDYKLGRKLLMEAQQKRIALGDMTPRKIYFGARMPYEALETFREHHLKHTVRKHYFTKFVNEPAESEADSIFLLPIFGPGDELRFASIYNSLRKTLPHSDFLIGVEPRLKDLFERSFPQYRFKSVRRVRINDVFNVEDYNRLASSTLRLGMDNNAVDAIDETDEFCLVTDLLANTLTSYEAFPGTSYLKADPAKVEAFRARLPKDKPLIGFSWRSSLTTHSRNEHYLTIEELAPILAQDGVQFVNLQYDDCSKELAWAEKHFPGKIINFEDLDQYNDLDSVAALMQALDLIIAPATTVVELAGALGCPTWLTSNSSELHWRKLENSQTDEWHNSVTHVEGAILKDKDSLVKSLKQKLDEYAASTVKTERQHQLAK